MSRHLLLLCRNGLLTLRHLLLLCARLPSELPRVLAERLHALLFLLGLLIEPPRLLLVVVLRCVHVARAVPIREALCEVRRHALLHAGWLVQVFER